MPEAVQPLLEIRVHPALPFGSAIMLDHRGAGGKIQIETKPYKAGLQKSFAFEVVRMEPDGLYDVLGSAYDALLADGRTVSIEEVEA